MTPGLKYVIRFYLGPHYKSCHSQSIAFSHQALAMTEPLPFPQPAPIKDKLQEFDSVPLFMRSLPEDDTEDIAISALQSLAYEGTPNGL